MAEIGNIRVEIDPNAVLASFTSSSDPTNTEVRIASFPHVSIKIEDINSLSVSQFAREAHVTPQAVRKMISERRLDAKKLGEQYVISREELNRYLQDR